MSDTVQEKTDEQVVPATQLVVWGTTKWRKNNDVGAVGDRVVSFNDLTRKQAIALMGVLNTMRVSITPDGVVTVLGRAPR